MFFVIFVILSPDEGDRFRSRIYHAFHFAIKFDFSREGFHLIKWCWNLKRDSILLCPLWIFVSYIAEVHTQFEHFRSRSTLYGISTVSYLIAPFIPYCLGSHVVWFQYTFCTYSPFHCMFWNFHPACNGGDCWFLSFARNTWCSSLRSEWYYP